MGRFLNELLGLQIGENEPEVDLNSPDVIGRHPVAVPEGRVRVKPVDIITQEPDSASADSVE